MPETLRKKENEIILKYETPLNFIMNCLKMIGKLVFLLLTSESKLRSMRCSLMGSDLLPGKLLKIVKSRNFTSQ